MAKRQRKVKDYDNGWQPDLLGAPPRPAQETPVYLPPCERAKLSI